MMTTHIRFLTTALVGLSLASGAFAADEAKPAVQAGQGGQFTPERQLEMLTESLTLTPEQSAKIKPIMERDREKMRELREDKSLSQEDRRAKLGELARTRTEEIRAVLTPEQQEKYKALMEKRREAMEKRRAEREGATENK